jgi:hypothetical protein
LPLYGPSVNAQIAKEKAAKAAPSKIHDVFLSMFLVCPDRFVGHPSKHREDQ